MKLIKTLFLITLIGIIGLLGFATFVEQARGPLFVSAHIYHTWWFFALWALLALLSVVIIAHNRLWRRTSVCLLHLSFVVILAGAATSFITSNEGILHLREGLPANEYVTKDAQAIEELPFDRLVLDSFRVVYYPGTEAPQDFVSYISYAGTDRQTGTATISMNNIFTYRGYRFYQSSFDPDRRGTILTVAYDPWGTPLTYFGYALLGISMLLVLLSKKEEFRTLLRHPLLRNGALAILLAVTSASPATARSIPTINKEKADKMARMPIVYNDRVAPLSTLAHDFTQKLYGRPSYKGLSAEQVLYGWLQRPDVWKNEPMLKIKDATLRRQLGIEGQYARLADLFDASQQYKLQALIEQQGSETKAIRELDEKVGIILMLTNGTLIRPAENVELPSETRISGEILYNNVPFAKVLFMVNLTFGLLTFILLVTGITRRYKTVGRLSSLILLASFATLLFSYLLRWYISGRIPLSNGYETMQFLALSIMFITLLMHRRFAYLLPFGFLLSGFTLLVAFLGEMNPQITPLMPVLQSPLLSTHVSVIMMAYALLAFMVLNGIYALILIARHRTATDDGQQIAQLTLLSRLMLYPAVFLLAVGIFLGAVWANVSWGSYWQWDPKESWALITLMAYAVPLHRASINRFNRPLFYHVYMVCAFLTVVITYFGVNYLLGGMHSYA